MTSDPSINVPSDEPENGVLAESGAIDTSDLGLLTTNTAHVNVILPTEEDEDDDDVVDDDDISILFDSLLSGDTVTAQQEDAAAVALDDVVSEPVEDGEVAPSLAADDAEELDVVEAELIEPDAEDLPEEGGSEGDLVSGDADDLAAVATDDAADDLRDVDLDFESDDDDVEEDASVDEVSEDVESEDDESDDVESDDVESDEVESDDVESDDVESDDVGSDDVQSEDAEPEDEESVDDASEAPEFEEEGPDVESVDDVSDALESDDEASDDEASDEANADSSNDDESNDDESNDDAMDGDTDVPSDVDDDAADAESDAEDEPEADESDVADDVEPSQSPDVTDPESAVEAPASDIEPALSEDAEPLAASLIDDAVVDEAPADELAEPAVTAEQLAVENVVPATTETPVEAHSASDSAPDNRESVEENTVPETRDIHDLERVAVRTGAVETTPAPRRLGDVGGDASRETPDLLTADRLLDPNRKPKPEPEGAWQHFVYSLSGKRINLGDGKRARERKALTARISAPIIGGSRFVPVLSRKGGVGKTTVTTLIGMALADARDDRVVAVDANPDRGTLAERISRSSSKTVRDLVRVRDEIRGYNDLSGIVSRDETRLDVLASDSDPRVAEAFSDTDYRHVAEVASRYYSIVLTDTGTGIVHSVMGATLDLADQLVIVAGLSVDEARAASETLTWLETNGFADIARGAIVVLNQTSTGAPVVRMAEVEEHFRTRVSEVVRIPYDPMIASGSAITFRDLQPETRVAARELAALVVAGLRGTGA